MGLFNNPQQLDTLLHPDKSDSWGGGDQPPPSQAWSGSLIANILQESRDQITKAVVLVPGEVILFFGRWSLKEGLLYHNA